MQQQQQAGGSVTFFLKIGPSHLSSEEEEEEEPTTSERASSLKGPRGILQRPKRSPRLSFPSLLVRASNLLSLCAFASPDRLTKERREKPGGEREMSSRCPAQIFRPDRRREGL